MREIAWFTFKAMLPLIWPCAVGFAGYYAEEYVKRRGG